MSRKRRGQRERATVTAMIAVCALLAGFAAGRLTAGIHITSLTEIGSDEAVSGGETVADAADTGSGTEESAAEEAASEGTEEGTEEETSEAESQETDQEDAGEASDDTEAGDSELVDAADMEYETSSEDAVQVTHEAVTSVSDEISIVDVSTIENVTLYEAVLPDGYTSTLYGKTGTAEMQVVVFGDSQFGNFVDEGGLAYLISRKMHANVYNLAMGGKTASVDPEEQGNVDIDTWEETCGVSMVKAVCGLADGNIVFNGWDYQKNVFNSCDFSKTDVFIIEFGVNDYLAEREMANEENLENYFSYYGALETMITDLRTYYPTAAIVVCTPTYAQFWESGTGAFLGDSNIISNFYGTLYNYAQTATHLEDNHSHVLTVNAYMNADIDIYSAPDDLLDGIHLTDSGREKYAALLSRIALRAVGYDIGEGVDPDTIDWVSQTLDEAE